MSDTEALFEAIRAGDSEGLSQLLQKDPSLASARGRAGVSALMTTLYHRRPELTEIVLGKVDALDIFEAVALGEREIVGELLKEDATRLSACSEDGFSPLHLASFFDHPPMVERLIEKGAEVNATSHNTMKVQPLHSAAAGRSAGSVRALIGAGADVNAKQRNGWTPLHSAAQSGDAAMARMLVEAGADLQAESDDGQKPIDVAQDAGFDTVL